MLTVLHHWLSAAYFRFLQPFFAGPAPQHEHSINGSGPETWFPDASFVRVPAGRKATAPLKTPSNPKIRIKGAFEPAAALCASGSIEFCARFERDGEQSTLLFRQTRHPGLPALALPPCAQ